MSGPKAAGAPAIAKINPTISPTESLPKKSPINAGNSAVTPPYERPNSAADTYSGYNVWLEANPRNESACNERQVASEPSLPTRSEIGPIIRRPKKPDN